MPITKYRTLFNQTLNLANLYRQKDFALQTEEDRKEQLKQEYEGFKQFEELKQKEGIV